jgi:DNA-binding LacI/PurR family transcriptional regulator
MKPLPRLSVLDQTVAHLREGLRTGMWGQELPGVLRLARQLDVSKDAVRAALQRLEREGLLLPEGHGKRRRVAGKARAANREGPLRVAILLREPLEVENGIFQRMMFNVQRGLQSAGHQCIFAPKSQSCLGYDVRRIGRMVGKEAADAWVICAGSGELIEWFGRQQTPAIAVGGRRSDAPVTRVAMDLIPGMKAATQHLTDLGHRRVVLICPSEWRQPKPGLLAQAFLDELAALIGAEISPQYHLPDWEPTARGFRTLLGSLFRVTPPTALIVVEPMQAVAALSFLAQRRLRVPQDVSLVVRSKDSALEWCVPPLAHFQTAEEHFIRHALRWARQVARGNVTPRRIVCPVGFVPGESTAPPSVK